MVVVVVVEEDDNNEKKKNKKKKKEEVVVEEEEKVIKFRQGVVIRSDNQTIKNQNFSFIGKNSLLARLRLDERPFIRKLKMIKDTNKVVKDVGYEKHRW